MVPSSLITDCMEGIWLRQTTRGGSDTSIDNNNVFAVQPRMYLESAAWAAIWLLCSSICMSLSMLCLVRQRLSL